MNDDPRDGSAPKLGLTDILYVVFRHKWKIALISAAGFAVALALPFFAHPNYQSEAKLLIKYVVENKSPTQVGANGAIVQPPDDSGQNIINTELEILTSMDLALQVADTIGPERIIGSKGGGNDRYRAAGMITKSLTTEVPKRSNVVRLTFQHSDPEIARAVLLHLIDGYVNMHADIHRGGKFDNFLTEETDKLRTRLHETEENLREALTNVGVTSLEQAKRSYSEQVEKLREKIFDAEAELAERQAVASLEPELRKPEFLQTNFNSITTNEIVAPFEKTAEYQQLCDVLSGLRQKERDLLAAGYSASSSIVSEVRKSIVASEQKQRQLEKETPGLLKSKRQDLNPLGSQETGVPRRDPELDAARAFAVASRLRVLTNQLDEVQKRAVALEEAEPMILELQRKRDREEEYYTNFMQNLEQLRINEQAGSGKVSNISTIQTPSAPTKAASKLRKTMALTGFGGMAMAFGLAFLIEFFWDKTVRKPGDVETRTGLPVFLNIPLLKLNSTRPLLGSISRPALLHDISEREDSADSTAKTEGALIQQNNGELRLEETSSENLEACVENTFRPFSEALRDRLMSYFELKQLIHKPKLVAVTSCGGGSGVSTVASGLAAALSETDEGNVLLVEMNAENGAAHYFHNGSLQYSIDDALHVEKRPQALVQNNLYVVREETSEEKLPGNLPKRFKRLVPRLKASDYDYIIFDMPAVTQVSLTPRLARFMDMVLMVVESGKTDRDLVKRATNLLAQSTANIGVVLNKTRSYLPRAISPEL